jgi:15-cis-phytoene synthase
MSSTRNGNGTSPAGVEERGYAECWEILREHGKTFHLMARLLGPERGSGIAALYGFARVADDLVDERPAERSREEVRGELHRMLEELDRAAAGQSQEPRWVALGQAIRGYAIPLQPFHDLVAGLEMDLDRVRYRTFSDLELYCYRVAGTVGLMITPVAGYRAGSDALEYAKILGTAMQLTNILRDVGEDHQRGLVYLPEDELELFGVAAEDLPARRDTPAFRELMEYQIERARRLYDRGLGLIPLLTRRRGRAAFQFAVDAYSAILDKIRDNRYDVFTQRASLSLPSKLGMVPASAWRAWRAGGAGGGMLGDAHT